MNTSTITLGRPGVFAGRTLYDWLFAALVAGGTVFAFARYHAAMDGYEKGILLLAAPVLPSLGQVNVPVKK